ncbi:alpha-2-macroglobulin [Hephaestia sp. GCM10023244]|uniref:alpha-2-macroglobulin family protein n=1 Tax=unclassified Hephaestia TaxID=2631281 RepID=UPI0020779C0C|nr:MG2 domain-containing protein [Hephaestia sp. MAHUQ-44]MCM8731210.1 MG2 domain-containing protein [Hephaestia sp. MAHUQ-44]
MKLFARAALLAAMLAPFAALGDSGPQVVMASPGIGDGAIERFTVRFNQAMVPLGDPRAATPFTVKCPVEGQGRWVDQTTFVHEFARPLPGGVTCNFDLRDDLKSLSGYAIGGQRHFTVDSGGPVARAVLPYRYGGDIEEDQVFLVAANMPATPQSVATGAYCAVDGIGEKIAVDVLDRSVPAKLLGAMGTDLWEIGHFLDQAGMPQTLPEDVGQREQLLAGVTALKCRRPLPPGRDMALVWGAGIKGANGKTAGAEQRFDFTVRKAFAARFECGRVNPQAGCNPVEDAHVRFSAPIAMDQANAIRLVMPDGAQIAPTIDKSARGKATIADLTFKAPLPPAVTAKLTLPADIKDESGRMLSNAERFPLEVRIDEAPPLVKFAAGFGILEASQGGVLPVTVRNVEPALQGRNVAISGQRLRVNGSDREIAEWLRKVDQADNYKSHEETRGKERVRINDTGAEPILSDGTGTPMNLALPGKGKTFEVVGIPLKQPGFYVVELASPALGKALLGRDAPRYVAAAALVTNMSVHFKWGRDRSLVWVTALDTGKPIANARVQISDSCTGTLLAKGVTDRSGGLNIPAGLPEPENYGNCESQSAPHPLIVSARLGDDMSFVLTGWDEGIRPYDFDLPYGYSATEPVFHTVFDRALVRQGETIHMKHIVRQPKATGFAASPAFTGTLKLSHRGSDTQFELPLKIDANGTGESSWVVPKGAPMGDYDLTVVTDDNTVWTDQSFRVDEYRLPTMRATITGPKEAQVKPKSVPLDLFVGYLSGGGASRLPVSLRVGWFDSVPSPQGYDGYSFGGAKVVEGVKPLNPDGEETASPLPPTQTIPLTLGADGTARSAVDVPQSLDGPASMRVEMDYQDANGETLTASQQIALYPSAIQLGVKTDGWMMKQDDLRLRLVALDTAGKPVKGRKISVAVYSRQILTARRRLIGGFYAYDNQMQTTRLDARCSATSDAQGLAWCTLAPDVSGEVYVVATTTDSAGNQARATRSVWLAGDDDWWFGGDNGDRMDVIPERQEYKAGETARFQVRMPFRSAHALVTVEREGVLASYVTAISGKDPVIEVKLPGSYAPDVYVSVLAVRGRVDGFWSWLSHLAYKWGLPFGSPVATRPTATVDLAKPAYRLGIAKVKVGWEAHRLEVAVKADRERYAARATANVDVQVKRPDGTPARAADVAFVAVDEALLQLAPNPSWDVLDAMMGERPLSVLTSTAQMQVVGKRHYGRKALAPGGGGGEGDLSGLNRTNFQPVLLWKGHVALDAQGHARIAVPLSDSLSSFKLVAIATEGANLFGTGSTSVRTAQDLSLYSGLPPLVRSGDFFAAGFTLRNGSDKPMTVTATVDVQPRVATGKPLTLTIPAGGAAPIAWNLTAPEGVSNLKWHVTARSTDGKTDQLTVDQEVIPAVPVSVWAATLTRVSGGNIPIAAPAGALPGRGTIDIRLSDTLAPPMAGVRAFMAAYPYVCIEQLLSRAIVLDDQAAWQSLAAELPLYQAPDGLLRYFPSDTLDGSEALTAYVLSISSEAGLPLPDGVRTRMIEALGAVIDGRLRNQSYGDPRLTRLAALAALARAGAASPAMLGQIGMPPGEMPTGVLADYLITLDHIEGLANGADLKASVAAALRTRLVYEGTRLDISDSSKAPWWLMSSNDEAAIKALIATLGRPGWQDDAPKMMVGVAQRQLRGRWDTTPSNAWGAIAVRKFAQLYPATAITGTTTLTLGTRTVSRDWPLASDARAIALPLPARQTSLVLRQTGGEGPWATVSVSAAVPLTKPLAAGYQVKRQVSAVSQRTKGVLTRGDVLKVTIQVEATAERNWVVVSDPIPAGATIIGDLGGQSQMLAEQGSDGGGIRFLATDGSGKLWDVQAGVQAAYIERRNDAWRAYFDWVPRGRFEVSYLVRLNGAGHFQLPPTHVEAMYSPEIHADLPNQPVTVRQR